MKARPHVTIAIAIALGMSFLIAHAAPAAAAQTPVDKSGLDILCSGKGDQYSPPPKPGGISSCIFADGQVMTCDSKTEKCEVKQDAKAARGINAEAMTLRTIKQLNDKVDRLSARAASSQAQQAAPAEAPVAAVVNALVAAQAAFDVARLDEILAPEYVEISPLGEVDSRSAVLGFYAPEKKPAAGTIPRLTLDQIATRIWGDTAIASARVSFTPSGAAQPAGAAMRVVFVLRESGGTWRVVSSQYTPIREKRG